MNAIARTLGFAGMLAGLVACAARGPVGPWHVGEFRAPKSNGLPEMVVTCRPNEACAVAMARASGQLVPVEIPIKGPPKPLDVAIPNNNLAVTRKAATHKPDWYKDPSFGPMLTPLRPVLDANATFTECVDLDGTGYLAMCSLSPDPRGEKSVMLLMTTMNGACGTLPFCAYYFVPLARVPAR